jgi:hypothetical protein
LFVGSTPWWRANVQQRGPGFQEVACHPAAVAVAGAFAGVAADDWFELALELADRELKLAAVMGVLVDLQGPEHALADPLAVLAELFLAGHAFGVRFEVTGEVCPADLAALEREVAIGPPAVRGHDRPGVGEQVLGVVFVTVDGDVQVGVTLVEDAPQRAALTGGPPPGLVHVHRGTGAQPLEQVIARVRQRVGDTGEHLVDRAGTDP